MPFDPIKYLVRLVVKYAGNIVSSNTKSINFTGAGQATSSSNDDVTVDIPGVGVGGLLAANNLSDVANAGTSRTNLGLGNSATNDVGTGAGNVAAGNHNHSGVYQPADADLDTWATKTAPSGSVVGDTDTQTMSGKTLTSPVIQGSWDGWVLANETWTYASSTTFTISGDLSGKYQRGDRIKLTQTTVKYFVVLKVSFSAGTTTVTITGGTDYTLASAAISLNYYSKEASPQGYPDWFTYTPTWTGFSANPTTDFCRFNIIGSTCEVNMSCTANGTSNATTFLISAPNGILSVGQAGGVLSFPVDNGTALTTGFCSMVDASNSITFRKTLDTSTSWTNVNGKRSGCFIRFRFSL